MGNQKFTVFLMPLDEGGYQVIFPYYPNCITDGETLQEALDHAKEAMEGILQADARTEGIQLPATSMPNTSLSEQLTSTCPKSLWSPPRNPFQANGWAWPPTRNYCPRSTTSPWPRRACPLPVHRLLGAPACFYAC